MKKLKGLLSAFAVLVIVSSALAFKASNYFASGSVWCDDNACTANQQVAFKIDPEGTVTAPCGPGVHTAYIRNGSGQCEAVAVGQRFTATADQSN